MTKKYWLIQNKSGKEEKRSKKVRQDIKARPKQTTKHSLKRCILNIK